MEGIHGRVLYLDPFSGIAGDMFLGLLLDLGVDENALVAELERLGVRFDLSVSQVNKNGIAAISTKVSLPVSPEVDEDEEDHVHCDECGHDHGQDEAHVHDHPHSMTVQRRRTPSGCHCGRLVLPDDGATRAATLSTRPPFPLRPVAVSSKP